MNDLSGWGCLSLLCLTPIITFTFGLMLGRDKLPFRIRVERTTAIERYEVDDGDATKWQ